jgi:hypothetical protein
VGSFGTSATEMHLSPEALYQRTLDMQNEAPFALKRKRISDAGLSGECNEANLRAEVNA